MAMSRKDYVKFARVLNKLCGLDDLDDQDEGMLGLVVGEVADIFQDDNERFDRERFLDAVYNGKGI